MIEDHVRPADRNALGYARVWLLRVEVTFFFSSNSFFVQNCWQLNHTCLLCVEIGVVVDVCCCEQVHTACPPTATSVLQETYVMRKSRCASVTRAQNSCGKENKSLAGIGLVERNRTCSPEFMLMAPALATCVLKRTPSFSLNRYQPTNPLFFLARPFLTCFSSSFSPPFFFVVL